MRRHAYLLSPREYDVFFQQVSVIQVFEDDGDTGQQLTLMELHQALDATEEVLLSLFIIVAKLEIKFISRMSYRRQMLHTTTQSRFWV